MIEWKGVCEYEHFHIIETLSLQNFAIFNMNMCNIPSISVILTLVLLVVFDCVSVENTDLESRIVSISTDVYVFSELIKNGYIPHSIADSYSKFTELNTISVTDVRKHLKAWKSRLLDSPIVNELFQDIIFSFLCRRDIWDNFELFQIPWHSLFPWIRLLVFQRFQNDTKLEGFRQRICALSLLIEKATNSKDSSNEPETRKVKFDIIKFISGKRKITNLEFENSISLYAEDYVKNIDHNQILDNLKNPVQKLTNNLNSYIREICESKLETENLVIHLDSLGHVSVSGSSFIFKNLAKFGLDPKAIHDHNLLRLLISRDDISKISVKNRLQNHHTVSSSMRLALCSLSKPSSSVQIISIGFFTIILAVITINYLNIMDNQGNIFMIPSLYAVITIRSTTIRHITTHKDRLSDLLLQTIPCLPLSKFMISKAFIFFNFLCMFTVLSHLLYIMTDKDNLSNSFNTIVTIIISSIFVKISCGYAPIYIISLLLYTMSFLNLLLSIYCLNIAKIDFIGAQLIPIDTL